MLKNIVQFLLNRCLGCENVDGWMVGWLDILIIVIVHVNKLANKIINTNIILTHFFPIFFVYSSRGKNQGRLSQYNSQSFYKFRNYLKCDVMT